MLMLNQLVGFGVGSEILTTQTISDFSTSSGSDFGGYTMVSRNTPLTAGDRIRKIGAYSTNSRTVVVKIYLRLTSTTGDVVVSESFSHAGGGWEDFTLSADYTIPGSGEYDVAAYSATAWADNATTGISRAYKLADITGSGVTGMSEDTIVGMLPLRVVKVS